MPGISSSSSCTTTEVPQHLPPAPGSSTAPVQASERNAPYIRGLLRMPKEIIERIFVFCPDSSRSLHAVSSGFTPTCTEFLRWNAEAVVLACSSTESPLHELLRGRLCRFIPDLPTLTHRSCIQLHMSIAAGIHTYGVGSHGVRTENSPDRILSPHEIDQFHHQIHAAQDFSLQRMWGCLRRRIVEGSPLQQGVPEDDASAQEVRTWMHRVENQPVLRRVSTLDLNDRKLTCLPLEIRLCRGLQTLGVTHNQLVALPEGAFQGLTALSALDLSHNQLSILPEGVFQGLTSLVVLNFRSNQLNALPEGVFQGLTRLEKLGLLRNQLNALPGRIFHGLPMLQMLALAENHLVSLPEGIFHGLTALRTLGLDLNQLVSLPEGIFHGLTALRDLSLSQNQLGALPERVFDGLTALQRLVLFTNQMPVLFPELFHDLTALEKLALDDNQLVSLPERIFERLTALRHLSMSTNHLSSLPEGVFQGLPALRVLDVSENELIALPERVFDRLGTLEGLLLGRNRRLLIPYEEFRGSDLAFLETMRGFFTYRCSSSAARFYQLAAGNASPDILAAAFNQIPASLQECLNQSFYQEEACHPNTAPAWWEQNHRRLDQKLLVAIVFKKYVVAHFLCLNQEQKSRLYYHVYDLGRAQKGAQNLNFDLPNWGEVHALKNIPRLIDAMVRTLQ